ncbi:MAG: hypothetical protein QXS20_03320 [Candidatus Thorarchaeota archaeon]
MSWVSSEYQTFRFVVAGDLEAGFVLCTRFVGAELAGPEAVRELLSRRWPMDEWSRLVTVMEGGRVTTVKADVELHGPWVWDLYSVMDPHDYFRRFDGAALCVSTDRPESFSEAVVFFEAFEQHTEQGTPSVLAVASQQALTGSVMAEIEKLSKQYGLQMIQVDLNSGKNVQSVFRTLAEGAIRRSTS